MADIHALVTGRSFLEGPRWHDGALYDGGNGMLFSMANGDQNFPFCKYVGGSPVNGADCGA